MTVRYSVIQIVATIFTCLTVVISNLNAAPTAAPVEAPSVDEIIHILKTYYVDGDKIDAKLLNEASVIGLLGALDQGAKILSAEEVTAEKNDSQPLSDKVFPSLARAEVIDPSIGYIWLQDFTSDVPKQIEEKIKIFTLANAQGYIIDLRFCAGQNYDIANSIASYFVNKGTDLFSLKSAEPNSKVFRSIATSIPLVEDPLMILVNDKTAGCCEALAGALRVQDRSLIIGNSTAGRAASWQDVALANGRILRVATAKVMLASTEERPAGSEVFPRGITPDIEVDMPLDVAIDVLYNFDTNTTLSATLEPQGIKKNTVSEADLVKAFRGEAIKDDIDDDSEDKQDGDKERKTVRDIVLQRAVDILKGIRILSSKE